MEVVVEMSRIKTANDPLNFLFMYWSLLVEESHRGSSQAVDTQGASKTFGLRPANLGGCWSIANNSLGNPT
jgi:hypothetical protein